MIEDKIILPTRSTTRSIKRVVPFLKEHNIKTILDYGSGTLRNTNYLLRNGFKVTIVDKKEQLIKIMKKPEIKYIYKIFTEDDKDILNESVDAVFSNFVFNLLSDEEQIRMLYFIKNILKSNGYFLIEIKKLKNRNSESYIYEQQSGLDKLIVPLGFDRIYSYINLHSLSSLYQKVNYY